MSGHANPDPKAPARRLTGAHRTNTARQAARLYNGGASIRTIAHDLDLSYGLTHQLLTEAEVVFRTRGGRGPKPPQPRR